MFRKLSILILSMLWAFTWVSWAGGLVETTEDKTALGDWEVTVDADVTNVVTAIQSGTGKIIKKGAGYLVLQTDNTFTGGVDVQAGFVRAAHNNALGTGLVTIQGGATQYCELQVMGAGKEDTSILTITNDIHVVGETSGKYPALYAFGQKTTLTGNITADANFTFLDDDASTAAISEQASKYATRYQYVVSLIFKGRVTAATAIDNAGVCRFQFYGPVTTPLFDSTIYRTHLGESGSISGGNAHSSYEFFATNSIGTITTRRNGIYPGVENAFPNTILHHKRSGAYSQSTFYFRAYSGKVYRDQILGGLTSEPCDTTVNNGTKYGEITTDEAHMLTITGVPPEGNATTRELVTGMMLNKKLSLVLDAYTGFTQTISNRDHTMSGTITVKKGTFRVTGNATFTNLTGIAVEQGARFEMLSSTNALKYLTSLDVKGAATFTPAAMTLLTNQLENLSLSITDGAALTFPEGTRLVLKSLIINGVTQNGGPFTSANVPGLSAGVTFYTYPQNLTSGTWTGAASPDSRLETVGNWKAFSTTPALTDGSLDVTLDSDVTNHLVEGHGIMTYADGTALYQITNAIPYVSNDTINCCFPFHIRPALPEDTLCVYRGIHSDLKGQLILSGHITMPEWIAVGNATLENPYGITYRMPSRTKFGNVSDVIRGTNLHSTAMTLPLVVSNATIDLAVCVSHKVTEGQTYYALPGTTNVFNGPCHNHNYRSVIVADKNALITFNGGVVDSQSTFLEGQGEIRFINKPFCTPGSYLYNGITVVLDAEGCNITGNTAREGLGLVNGKVICKRNGCFNTDTQQIFFSNKNDNWVDFTCTTQHFGRVNFTTGKGSLTGIYPAMMEVTGQVRPDSTAKYIQEPAISCPIYGGLGIHVCGADSELPLSNQAFTSCGDLEASAGTLKLEKTASWLNGTNFTVRGTGVIAFTAANQVNRAFAQMHFGADGGTLDLAEGVTVRVAAADVDGVKVPSGVYNATSTGLMAGRITGAGTLRISPLPGTKFIIR